MSFSQKLLKSVSRGFSLPLVMAAVGVSGFAAVAITQVVSNRQVEQRLNKISVKRNRLIESSRRAITTGPALYLSATQAPNSSLAKCVLGTGAGTCTDGLEVQFEAFQPIGSGGAAVRTSGSGGSKVAYDMDGNICVGSTSSTCPFYLQSFFKAVVAGGVNYQITVRTEILHDAAFPLSQKLGNKVYQPGPIDRTVFEGRLGVAEIMSDIHQSCNANSVLTGVGSQGQITCQCVTGYIQAGVNATNGLPNCTTKNSSCAAGQKFLGMDNYGNALCETYVPPTVGCWTITATDDALIDCGGGNNFTRMRSIANYRSQCETRLVGVSQSKLNDWKADNGVGSDRKTYDAYVECGNLVVTCCNVN